MTPCRLVSLSNKLHTSNHCQLLCGEHNPNLLNKISNKNCPAWCLRTNINLGCTNPRHQVAVWHFCLVASHICWSSVWNFFLVTHLASRILRCLQDFWKICVALVNTWYKSKWLSVLWNKNHQQGHYIIMSVIHNLRMFKRFFCLGMTLASINEVCGVILRINFMND